MPVFCWHGEEGLKSQRKRDAEKRAACQRNGIALVEVDYKWDGTEGAIRKMIPIEFHDYMNQAE